MAALRLLLLDDCEESRNTAGSFLISAGYQVDFAVSSDAAIELARRRVYDLILMDAGFSATARAIRAFERSSCRQPVSMIVGLTRHALPQAREECLDAGMNDCDLHPTSRSGILRLAARWTTARHSGFGPGLGDLRPTYLASRLTDAATMRSSLAAGAFAAIRVLAHRMRGSGGTYGFPRLTELGADLETAAMASDSTRVRIALDRLDAELGTASSGATAPETAA